MLVTADYPCNNIKLHEDWSEVNSRNVVYIKYISGNGQRPITAA